MSFLLILFISFIAINCSETSYNDGDSEERKSVVDRFIQLLPIPSLKVEDLFDGLLSIIGPTVKVVLKANLPTFIYDSLYNIYYNHFKSIDSIIRETGKRLIDMEKDQKADVKNRQTDIKYLKVQLTDLKGQLNDIKAQLANVKAQLTDAKAQSADMKAQLTNIKAQLANMKAQLTDSKAQSVDMKAQLTNIKAQLANMEAQLTDAKAQSADTKAQLNKMETIMSEIRDNNNLWSLIYQALIMMVYFFISIITILTICITSILWIW